MKLSEKQKLQLKIFEGLRLKKYVDLAGVETIGYGHTGKNLPNTITKAQADEYLETDLYRFEKHVESYNSIYNLTPAEFDALVLFAFNIGNINQLTNYGKRTRKEIAEKILLYNKAGGKEIKGLTNRRQYEHDLFVSSRHNDDSTELLKDYNVLFSHVKNTYRLRSKPDLESGVIRTVTEHTPCKILGKVNDFYFVEIDKTKEQVFVYKDGIIWK